MGTREELVGNGAYALGTDRGGKDFAVEQKKSSGPVKKCWFFKPERVIVNIESSAEKTF